MKDRFSRRMEGIGREGREIWEFLWAQLGATKPLFYSMLFSTATCFA
jgi:hypothetical protein